ncbi:MAG: dihydrofolate reductase [Clostridiales bacterium]|nr:dihydrofolate reductase [Clostridiales bacterium]
MFSIPEDMRRFKTLTTGKTVVMGRGTLDSLPGGRPLRGRRNLVLTRDRGFHREGVEPFHSLAELLAALPAEDEAWVIGGASMYKQLLPCCGALYLTEVDAAPPADRFFPPLDEGWKLVETTAWREAEGLPYRFCRYER